MVTCFSPVGVFNDTAQGFWRDTSGLEVLRLAEDPVRVREPSDEGREVLDALYASLIAFLRMNDPQGVRLRDLDAGSNATCLRPAGNHPGGVILSGSDETDIGSGRGAS